MSSSYFLSKKAVILYFLLLIVLSVSFSQSSPFLVNDHIFLLYPYLKNPNKWLCGFQGSGSCASPGNGCPGEATGGWMGPPLGCVCQKTKLHIYKSSSHSHCPYAGLLLHISVTSLYKYLNSTVTVDAKKKYHVFHRVTQLIHRHNNQFPQKRNIQIQQ